MSLSRLYVTTERIAKGKLLFSGRDAHRISNVLRLKEGDELIVFDGKERECLCVVSRSSKGSVEVVVKKMLKREQGAAPPCRITLAVALPKKAKMDFIVEKAVELGAALIIPMTTERTIVKLSGDKIRKKVERWNKIAQGAAEQSGRLHLTQVEELRSFEEVLQDTADYELKMIFCINEKRESLKTLLPAERPKDILVLIGPEGDFTADEVRRAAKARCKLASLGRTVLKVDTAALAALSILMFYYG